MIAGDQFEKNRAVLLRHCGNLASGGSGEIEQGGVIRGMAVEEFDDIGIFAFVDPIAVERVIEFRRPIVGAIRIEHASQIIKDKSRTRQVEGFKFENFTDFEIGVEFALIEDADSPAFSRLVDNQSLTGESIVGLSDRGAADSVFVRGGFFAEIVGFAPEAFRNNLKGERAFQLLRAFWRLADRRKRTARARGSNPLGIHCQTTILSLEQETVLDKVADGDAHRGQADAVMLRQARQGQRRGGHAERANTRGQIAPDEVGQGRLFGSNDRFQKGLDFRSGLLS